MSIYCIYLTTYRGNRLPPFYIGSTSIKNIESGYKGSVKSKIYRKVWEEEIQNNPHLFNVRILSTYSSRQEAFDREEYIQRKLNVVESPMYMNLSYANYKMVTIGPLSAETKSKLSIARTGRKHTEETRAKMSKSHMGVKMPARTDSWREKQRISQSGRRATEETRNKMSESRKGRKHSYETIEKMRRAYRERHPTL